MSKTITVPESRPITGWHFSNGALGNVRDVRKIEAGSVFQHDGELILCRAGLHSSHRILDALKYAAGSTVSRTASWGRIKLGDDKLVAEFRRHDWLIDAEVILYRFARRNALDVIDLWNAPDVVVRYLKTGDESLRYAARVGAWELARHTAIGTMSYAARYAAWSAARCTASIAAKHSSFGPLLNKQSRRLISMVIAKAKRQGVA